VVVWPSGSVAVATNEVNEAGRLALNVAEQMFTPHDSSDQVIDYRLLAQGQTVAQVVGVAAGLVLGRGVGGEATKGVIRIAVGVAVRVDLAEGLAAQAQGPDGDVVAGVPEG